MKSSLDRKIESAARRAAEAKKNRFTLSVEAFTEGDFLPDGSKRNAPTMQEIVDMQEELRVTDSLLKERDELLRLIPACPIHGHGCIPHAMGWVRERLPKEKRYVSDGVKLLDQAQVYTVNKALVHSDGAKLPDTSWTPRLVFHFIDPKLAPDLANELRRAMGVPEVPVRSHDSLNLEQEAIRSSAQGNLAAWKLTGSMVRSTSEPL